MEGEVKPWHEWTEEEIYHLKKTQCKYCKYLAGGSGSQIALRSRTCEYGAMTGHSRLCHPARCKELGKFEPRTKSRAGKEFCLKRRPM